MIYQNSTDPVLVKKISLNIWFLRDQIEAEIHERISCGDEIDKSALTAELTKKYSKTQQEIQKTPEGTAEAETSKEDSTPTPETVEVEKGMAEHKCALTSKRISKDKVFKGQTILTEIHMDQVHFFSNREFVEGQSVVIEFLVPKRFSLNADIRMSRVYNHKTRIISENPLPFRNCANFTNLAEYEQHLLREFLSSIEPETPVVVKAKNPTKEESDDEFSDLEDFDI